MVDPVTRIENRLDQVVAQLGEVLGEVRATRATSEGLEHRLAMVEAELVRIRDFELDQVRRGTASQEAVENLEARVEELKNRPVSRRDAMFGGGGALIGSVISEGLHFLWRTVSGMFS